MFVYQKILLSERLFPNVVEADNRKIAVEQNFHVPEEDLTVVPALEKKLGHRFCFLQRIAVHVPK